MGEPSTPRPMNSVAAGEGKTLGFSGCSIMRTTQDEIIKRSGLDALIKALKEYSDSSTGQEEPHMGQEEPHMGQEDPQTTD
ncbi:hypothetical protein DY000_02018639 [Brassica cretica]|uniref:Uncharacterized protein n=1 Tax=Brassica cretica TaxID=69181 RepID=A0ABQ7CWI1_BRACR|nr:hypothetical protein DY000_02018639 [Brassica cretica]